VVKIKIWIGVGIWVEREVKVGIVLMWVVGMLLIVGIVGVIGIGEEVVGSLVG
jgi:hypothetical protein